MAWLILKLVLKFMRVVQWFVRAARSSARDWLDGSDVGSRAPLWHLARRNGYFLNSNPIAQKSAPMDRRDVEMVDAAEVCFLLKIEEVFKAESNHSGEVE